MEKQILGLAMPTDPRWVNIAEKNIEEILVDHAYCEQKAASSCISLIIQYPEKENLVNALTPVVAEEWSHFARVLKELQTRGWKLGPQRKDEYVEQLLKIVKPGGSRDQQLVERLLLNALVEARSCERFRLLSKEINDGGLRQFYHELMVSEAGHYRLFLGLAKEFMSKQHIEERWKEWRAAEAHIVARLDVRADRMH